MKIRYVTSGRMPTTRANGLQITKTCEALGAEGVEVNLVVPGENRQSSELKGRNIFDFYSAKRNFQVSPIWVPPAGLFGRKDIFFQDLYFSFVAGISSIFASGGTIVYSRQPRILIPALLFGRKAVFESHEGRWTFSVRLGVLLGLRIITITRASAEKYVSLGVKKERLAVSPDATDLSLFANLPSKEECRKIYGIGQKDNIAMYTGSFNSYAWKGLDVFLDASNKVKMPIKFFAVGGFKNEIAQLEATGKYPNVVFVEQMSHVERPKILSAADVLVIPNRKGKEISEIHTSPIKLFEYLAAGRPIVASKLPSLLEIVDENSAVIVEPNDPEALARGIEKVFADDKYAKMLAENARKLSLKYSWQERAKGIEKSIRNFYERC